MAKLTSKARNALPGIGIWRWLSSWAELRNWDEWVHGARPEVISDHWRARNEWAWNHG